MERLESQIKELLAQVEHPVYHQDLATLGMFSRIEEDGGDLRLVLRTPAADRPSEITLEAEVRKVLAGIEMPGKLKIRFEVDESMQLAEPENGIKRVKSIIAVGSGKGGVGKSTVSANLAMALKAQGKSVGLLDADIYGPSIGKMFGVEGRVPLNGDGQNKIYPHEAHGLKLFSFSFLMDPEQAVVWRGPMLGKAVEQFLFEVMWGELDYLIIDLPPGTGDVQLSLAQLIELSGAVVVTTPQNVALADARRAVTMFAQTNIPLLGIVENMSQFVCPSCGHVAHIFSKDGGEKFATEMSVPLLGRIPLVEEIMSAGESGLPIVAKDPESPVSKAYMAAAEQLIAREAEANR